MAETGGFSKHSRPKYKNITTATTTAVKADRGFLAFITVNGITATGSITVNDGSTPIGTIAAAGLVQGQTYPYACEFATLNIVTASAVDITVAYR